MISLKGLSFRQKSIAEALWTAENNDTLIALCLVYGKREVRVVQELMLAAFLDTAVDTVEDTDQAQQLLKQFRKQEYQ